MIYGANNKGGISYSVFLAKKRLNLILIDKDWETIEAAEKTIKERLEREGVDPRNMDIIKVQLSVFEEQNMSSLLENLSKKGEIRFFINTKNVRLAKKSQKRFQDLGHKEVYQIAHENIENFLCLLNVFLKSMSSVENAAVINVVNSKNDDMEWLK